MTSVETTMRGGRIMKGRIGSAAIFCIFLVAQAIGQPTVIVFGGSNQSFGQRGNPQAAINILGNVTDPNGIQSLTYRLNGAPPINLSMGPDTRRLLRQGDFNVDINTSALNSGANTVIITAVNNLSQTRTETVTVNYTVGQIWSLPYNVNWSSATSINSVAQIVDGQWTLSGGTVRATYLGYDRLVAIGDKTWTDYEVTVPITIYGIDPGGFGYPSNGPGVGLVFRWAGHTDYPIAGMQPKTGYLPLGAIGWYNWDQSGGGVRLKLLGNNLDVMQEDYSGFTMAFGVPYIFKMRVTTNPGVGGEYKLKVWQSGLPEPGSWTLQGTQSLSDPQSGSFCLVSHHVDATFGNVTVIPIQPDITPPVISNIQSAAGATFATITWSTNEFATSTLEYGLTTNYEIATVSESAYVNSHSIEISGLTPQTTYHFRVRSSDAAGNMATSSDQTFTTSTAANLVTDHFNSPSLNTSTWTFINPLGDASYSMTGTQLQFSVPGGVNHDVWSAGNLAPRVMQSINNTDFDVYLRFDTPVSEVYQLQGLIVDGGGGNFLRFDFVSETGVTRVFSASFVNGSPTVRINTNIGSPTISPLYLRVRRVGSTWTQWYSFDGLAWNTAGSFSHDLVVTSIGPFAGNAGNNPPAFTCRVNYFVNGEDPARVNVRALLEGPVVAVDSMSMALRPQLPLLQPYDDSPWNHSGNESVGSIPDSIVDWILLELRMNTSASSKVGTRAAFLQSKGRIVDLDGVSTVTFPGVVPGDYYVVVRHRNHLSVMSAQPVSIGPAPAEYSFLSAQSSAYGSSPMKAVTGGRFALYAGDSNTSGIVTASDANLVFSTLNTSGYRIADVNMSGIVTAADANVVYGNLNKATQVP